MQRTTRGSGRTRTTVSPQPRRRRRAGLTIALSALAFVTVWAQLPAGASTTIKKYRRWTAKTTTTSTTTSTTTTVPASGSPSGQAMPVGDLPGWHQVFADDFTTNVPLGSFPAAVSDKWSAYPDGWNDSSHNGTYMPSKVLSQSNGVLNWYLHTENGVHMVSAPLPKLPGGMSAGRYVVRFRADALHGYKTAWLLWPDSETWPRDGEIDFPEGDLDGTISAFMHRQNATTGSDQDAYFTGARYPTWHTAVIEWLPTRCTFILDGVVIGNSTTRVPNTSMHFVLQTETSLGAVPADATAGNVQLDWIAVYTPA